jgi:hypothetical protein
MPWSAACISRRGAQAVHLVLALQRNGKEEPGYSESGVIDQVFKVWRGGNSIFDGLQIRFDCEIHRQDFDLHGMRGLDVAGLLFQAVFAPRNQQQVAAPRGHFMREVRADTAGSAGYQGEGARHGRSHHNTC